MFARLAAIALAILAIITGAALFFSAEESTENDSVVILPLPNGQLHETTVAMALRPQGVRLSKPGEQKGFLKTIQRTVETARVNALPKWGGKKSCSMEYLIFYLARKEGETSLKARLAGTHGECRGNAIHGRLQECPDRAGVKMVVWEEKKPLETCQ